MYTNIADISDSVHQTKKDVLCAITTQKTVSFGTNNSGKLLTGICEDDTDCITYCAWHENAKLLKDKLQVGGAYMLQNVTVNICKPKFALTPRNLQLVLDDKSVVIPSNENKSYKSPLNLVPVKDVAQISGGETKCNIAGTIIEKQWQDITGRSEDTERTVQSKHLKVKVRDSEADIDVSFFRDAAHNFRGEIGDILLLRNTTAKVFGNYHVVQGNVGTYNVNPNYRELKNLSNLHIGPEAGIHMSPKKKEAQQTTINELHQRTGKQSFQAVVVDLQVKTYPKCPLVGCRKSLYYNENANTYSCDSCAKKYHVSSKGLTVTVTVEEDSSTKDITFFNDAAENFLQTTADNIHEDTERLLQNIKGDRYSFVVTAGKMKNEYICVTSSLIYKRPNETTVIDETSAVPVTEDGNNNECLPQSWRKLSMQKPVKQQLQFENNEGHQSDIVSTPHTNRTSPFIRTVTPDNYGGNFVTPSHTHLSVHNDYGKANTEQTFRHTPKPFDSDFTNSPTTFSQRGYDSEALTTFTPSSSFVHKVSAEQFNRAIETRNATPLQAESPPDFSSDKLANRESSYFHAPVLFGSATTYRAPSLSQEDYYSQASIIAPLYSPKGQKDFTGLLDNTPDLKCDTQLQLASPKRKRKFLSIEDML